MRYFHRTALPIADVLAQADRFFRGALAPGAAGAHRRVFRGTPGTVTIAAHAEGGHGTRVTAETDQVGESEIDRLARRFLATVHQGVHRDHDVRGAY